MQMNAVIRIGLGCMIEPGGLREIDFSGNWTVKFQLPSFLLLLGFWSWTIIQLCQLGAMNIMTNITLSSVLRSSQVASHKKKRIHRTIIFTSLTCVAKSPAQVSKGFSKKLTQINWEK
jgi:hypothetical protein